MTRLQNALCFSWASLDVSIVPPPSWWREQKVRYIILHHNVLQNAGSEKDPFWGKEFLQLSEGQLGGPIEQDHLVRIYDVGKEKGL